MSGCGGRRLNRRYNLTYSTALEAAFLTAIHNMKLAFDCWPSREQIATEVFGEAKAKELLV